MTRALCSPDNPHAPPPDLFFGKPGDTRTRAAKAFCMDCPLYFACQEQALAEGIPHGVFGGLDGRDRQRIWARTGGKPSGFDDAVNSAVEPAIVARQNADLLAKLGILDTYDRRELETCKCGALIKLTMRNLGGRGSFAGSTRSVVRYCNPCRRARRAEKAREASDDV